MPKVLIVLDHTSYRQLQRLADSDERAVDQQARYLLRRALREADRVNPQAASEEGDGFRS